MMSARSLRELAVGSGARHDRRTGARRTAAADPQAMRVQTVDAAAGFSDVGAEWNALARRQASPFLTVEWLAAWSAAFGSRTFLLLLTDPSGALAGGAALQRGRGEVGSPSKAHTGEWDVLARDERVRREVWRRIAELGVGHGRFSALLEESSTVGVAREELAAAGYGTAITDSADSPLLELPPAFEDLLAATSHNLRKQVRRRHRALAGEGSVVFRTTVGGERLADDLEAFFRMEASGWKGRAGTAILDDPRTVRLFGDFARAAAASGLLRLRLLELDGNVIAGDLACVFEGTEFPLKTGYDERFARLSPGLVLRAGALREAITEGVSRYDFLGGPDPYKLRWGGVLQRRVVLEAYRGPWRPALWWQRSRPMLRTIRDRIRRDNERRAPA